MLKKVARLTVPLVVCYCPLALLNLAVAQSNPEAPPSNKVLRWTKGSPGSDSLLRNGRFIEILSGAGIEIEAMLQDTGWKMRADVRIVNRSDRRIDVRPELFTFTVVKPKLKVLRFEDPDRLAQSIQRRANLGAALTQMGGAMQTEQTVSQSTNNGNVSVYDNQGNSAYGTYNGSTVTTTTRPDYDARRRADEQSRQIMRGAATTSQFIRMISLRGNTLAPGQQVAGVVYFQREKRHDATVLGMPIGEITFEFPFVWRKK